MAGGQFIEDKTCSLDTYKINVNKFTLKDMKTYMKVPRMHHTMIHVEEKGMILAVGGEDENGGLLDSCEMYNTVDNNWKMLNSLNYRSKGVCLCKFVLENKNVMRIFVYAFDKNGV